MKKISQSDNKSLSGGHEGRIRISMMLELRLRQIRVGLSLRIL